MRPCGRCRAGVGTSPRSTRLPSSLQSSRDPSTGEEANAPNRARVGRRWIRQGMPSTRACSRASPTRLAGTHADAEVIVGTSAGAVVGRVRCGPRSHRTTRARGATDTPLSPDGRRLVCPCGFATRAHLPPIPMRPPRRAAFPRCRRRMHSCAGRCNPGLCASARSWPRPCPKVACRPSSSRRACGRCSTAGPSSRCGSTPSHLDSGRRVTFGRDACARDRRRRPRSRPRAPFRPSSLRCRSTGFATSTVACTPRRTPILSPDSGSTSWSSARRCRSRASGVRVAPDQPARRLARFALGREVAQVRRAGTPVLTFQPTDADLARDGPQRDGPIARAPTSPGRGSSVGASAARSQPTLRDRAAILTTASTRRA